MVNFDGINEILKNYYGGSFFYGNSIPDKKLRNALYTYVPGSPKVYALYDATIFGSAKEGACFTQDAIHYKSGSTVRTIKYDEILSGTIGDGKINGTYCSVFTWCPGLIESIKKVNDPVDLTEAKKSMSAGSYAQAIRALDQQEKYVRNTPVDDVVVYKYMYIEAYLGLKDYAKAEQLLKSFMSQFRTNAKVSSLTADAEKQISEYKEQYERDLNVLKKIIEECEALRSEKNFDEAIEKMLAVELREDFTKTVKRDYYKSLIATYLLAEKPDDAEAEINELYEKDFIDSNEKTALDKQVSELRETLHRRFIQEQRELIAKQLDIARMFEKHGIFESASDTVIAAISSAPAELSLEKTNAFKFLVELLLSQYEYEAIYELRKTYHAIAKDELLGYTLSDKVEEHRSAHLEEYYTHLYHKAIYYMQAGKFQDARKYIDEAKGVKYSFDIRCAEVNLAMLEFKYSESRSLLDALISDQAQYTEEGVAESIAHFENQYAEMVNAISVMLKVYAITDNVEAILANDGYAGFVDADGLNLPSIAARFTNHNIIDALGERGYNCEFTRFMNGFGIAFLAAMQLDLEAFSDFIRRRIAGYEEYNCVINEDLDVIYPITEEIHRLNIENGIDYETAADVAIKDLYDKCILFFASLLDPENFDAVCAGMESEKTRQTAAVAQMKAELPAVLQAIDAECESKCTRLRSAMQEIKSLLLDVPDSREEKADAVASDLETSIISAIEFANKNAQIMKNEKEWQIKKCTDHIEKIQSRITMWTSMDRDPIVQMFKIPAAAVSYGEFDETCNMMSMTLGRNTIQVSMSQDLATALTETPDKVSIESNVSVVFNSSNQLVVTHQYVYSTEGMSSSAEFISIAQLQCNSVAEGILESLLPKLAD